MGTVLPGDPFSSGELRPREGAGGGWRWQPGRNPPPGGQRVSGGGTRWLLRAEPGPWGSGPPRPRALRLPNTPPRVPSCVSLASRATPGCCHPLPSPPCLVGDGYTQDAHVPAGRPGRPGSVPSPSFPLCVGGFLSSVPTLQATGEGFRGWDSPVDKQASHTPPWGPGGVKPGPLRTGPGQRQQPDQEMGVGVGPTAPGTGWACPRAGEALGPAREDPRHHRGALQGPGGQKVPASDPEVGSSGDQPPPWVLSKSPH